jgi:anthranilate phosphoribosyltransferase
MDVAALAATLVGARMGQVQMAAAARMMRMNAESAASIVQVIEAAQQNIERLANVAEGVGGNLDISV